MRAIPTGRRIRAGLAAGTVAVAVLATACTTTSASSGHGTSPGHSTTPSQDTSPGQGTLFGESAGGLSTLAQLVSPGARGLFQRAIVESGAYDLTQQPLAAAEAAGQAFAAKVGCASDTAACLRRLPVSTILSSQNPVGYTPDVDGAVLTQSIKTALASGQLNHVPVVIGTNHDEYRLFVAIIQLIGAPVTAANYQAMIASALSVPAAAASAIAAQYPLSRYPSPPVALGAVATDMIFACPALTAEESLSRYVPTYAYEFNDENAPELFLPPAGFPYGAAHASELQYVFDLNTVPHPASLSAAQRQLAAAMQQDWANMAKAGSPAAGWPRFSRASQQVLSLVPPRPQVETDFAAQHHCAFWAAGASAYWIFLPEAKQAPRTEKLRPGTRCGFSFKDLTREPDQVLVAWFTDDAGYRWQRLSSGIQLQAGDQRFFVRSAY